MFHFLCPCATLSVLVHAQSTLTLPSANIQGINEHKARSSNWSDLHNVVSCQPHSLSLHVRESQSGKAKHATLRLIQPQPLTLKVRIKDLIIVSTLKWDKEWNFFWEGQQLRLPLSKKKSVTRLFSWRETHWSILKCYAATNYIAVLLVK